MKYRLLFILMSIFLSAILLCSCVNTRSDGQNTANETKLCNCGPIEYFGEFVQGKLLVSAGDCKFFVDEYANVVIQDTFYYTYGFKGNNALVEKAGENVPPYSVIDIQGNTIIDLEENYDFVSLDQNGEFIRFQKGDMGHSQEGVMNLKGEIIIPLQAGAIYIYDGIAMIDHNMLRTEIYDLNSGKKLAEYEGQPGGGSEGLWVIMGPGSWNQFYLDSTGKEAFRKRYFWAANFSQGLAKVVDYEMIGFIDKNGETAIPFQYEFSTLSTVERCFSEGLCVMATEDAEGNDKIGYINLEGKIVIPHIYDDADDFENGYATVEFDRRMGLIDSLGNLIVHSNFSYFEVLAPGLYSAYRYDELVVFDNSNKTSSINFDLISESHNGRVVCVIEGELMSLSVDSVKANVAMNESDYLLE